MKKQTKALFNTVQPAEYCGISSKVCFDKKGALTAKNKAMDRQHVKLRVYPCPDCESWHVTKRL